jgi:hypothetical protein
LLILNFYIFSEYLNEGLGEVLTGQGSQGNNSRHKPSPEPDPELGLGSLVEVMSTKPLYGLIKWIGHLPDQKEPKKLIAGLEMVYIFEPRHNKTNIMRLRPAWIQISLRINAV